jgi:hypothetical protein
MGGSNVRIFGEGVMARTGRPKKNTNDLLTSTIAIKVKLDTKHAVERMYGKDIAYLLREYIEKLVCLKS